MKTFEITLAITSYYSTTYTSDTVRTLTVEADNRSRAKILAKGKYKGMMMEEGPHLYNFVKKEKKEFSGVDVVYIFESSIKEII